MKKKVVDLVKIQLEVGNSKNIVKVGGILGPRKVSGPEFIKRFNESCEKGGFTVGCKVMSEVSVYSDKTFAVSVRNLTGELLKRAAGIEKGAVATKKNDPVGVVSISQCEDVARLQLDNLNAYDLSKAVNSVVGTAKSIGLLVKEG